MEQKGNRHEIDRETIVFLLFIAGMAVYYGWRLFMLTPWYDELYTYYYFISRGPVYAAIHWPLPNNHICYSVLSACLGFFGNAAIALRGISYLCSLGSLILLFYIGRKCFGSGMALIPVFLYAGMHTINQLAVQGRGYALVTFCYLTAIYKLLHITVEHRDRGRDYVIFGVSLILALYAIPSSVYVVVPICMIGGTVLLVYRDYRRLVWLIVTSFVSALCTVGLYCVVWLAIGSNLLVKTEGSAYYGMGHGAVITYVPFQALKTGIDYMLATPYIQSVGRDGFIGKLAQWLVSLLNGYYVGAAGILAVVILLGVVSSIICIVHKLKSGCYTKETDGNQAAYESFVEIYLAGSILLLPIMLVVQSSLPYYRVFSFAGVVVAIAAVWLWYQLTEWFTQSGGFLVIKRKVLQLPLRNAGRYMPMAGSVICGILCVALLCTPSYREQYSNREAAIEDAYRQTDLSQTQKIAVTDCDQEYLLLFLYDIDGERITRDLTDADVMLADKFLLLNYDTEISDWSGDDWKLYLTPEAFRESDVTERMQAVYENERFVLYRKDPAR